MIEAEIDPNDLREFQLALKGLKPEELLKDELAPFGRSVGERTGEYPPDFPGNTYVRTGHLGESWYYRLMGSLAVEVGNVAIYAGYVHGPEQVGIHRSHGWRRLFEIGEAMLEDFVAEMEAKIEKLWT